MNLEKKKTVFVVCLIVVILASVFSAWMLLGNNRPHGEEYKALAEQLLGEARHEFEAIRGDCVQEVVLEVVNESWVIENWGVAYIDPEEVTMEENIYKTLFMIDQDVNLTEVKLEWTGMFHAAKWKGKIYVVEENFDITNEFKATSTFVHELTHIMQDDYSLPRRTTFDGTKALSALKEGDATLMADTFKNGGVVPPSAEVVTSSSSRIPESINNLNRFVYRYGVEFVKVLYNHDEGGWDAVTEAYKNLPNTTEQIMHPQKYFNQESAVPVESAPVTADWNLTMTDCFGEYFVLVMLDHWISVDDAELAAEGWGGDVFNYYKNGDDFLFTWDIVWDSNEDAYDFYDAFQDMMDKTPANNITDDCWFAYGRYLSIQCNENATLIVSSANEMLVQ
ncbi:MAG: hypothetical protein CW691_08620 [Candidatus Bathyarchaeum sp.]|nr:MAG: hypothetical protein CW691_08620 [Candidatus Bathyarchaeum sp.]